MGQVLRADAGQAKFIGKGPLIAWGGLDGDVELTWQEVGSARRVSHVVQKQSVGWAFTFEPGEYRLTRALVSEDEWLIRGECVVSEQDPVQPVELFMPGGVWLDVVDASTKQRLPVAKVSAKLGDDIHDEIGKRMQGRRLGREERMKVLEEVGLWSISDAKIPLMLPSLPHGKGVEVQASGYSPAELSGIDSPGVHVVELSKIQACSIRVIGGSTEDERFEVLVHLNSDDVDRRFTNVASGTTIVVPYETKGVMHVRVIKASDLGSGELQFAGDFDIAPGNEDVLVDLSSWTTSPQSGSLTASVESSEEIEKMNTWYVVLRPVNAPEGIEFEQYPESRLAGWGALTPRQHYRKTFMGIAPGEYELLLAPINHRETITVRDGEETKVEIRVPGLAELRVWPVDKEGNKIPAAASAGQLLWKAVNAESKAREESDPIYKTNKGPSEWVVDLQRGFAHSAQSEDGSWVVRTFPGQEVKLFFMGPPELLGEAKVVQIDEMYAEATFAVGTYHAR